MQLRIGLFFVSLVLAILAAMRFASVSPTGMATSDITTSTPIDWQAVLMAVAAITAAVESLTRGVSALIKLLVNRDKAPDTPN